MEGDWFNYKPGDDGERKMLIDTIGTDNREAEVIKRKDIPFIINENMKNILNNYHKTKIYGLPYSGGWAQQPCISMDIIWTLDNEKALIQSRKTNGS